MPASIPDIELERRILLGRYRIVRRLAEGGMGTVYLARTEGAEGFTRPAVIKRMRPDVRNLEDGARLFTREAKILSKMQHPNVLNVIDFGVEDGAYVMVLEYVHGYSLLPLLDYRYGKKEFLPIDICIYITRQVLSALQYAHHFESEDGREVEIVHRDISPDNVLVSNRGRVHLLDFGIASMRGDDAQATKSGVFRGKLGYAAPETLHGEQATARSDQYSAGVLLMELLTFISPFSATTMAESVQKMVNEVPEPPSSLRPSIDPGLDAILLRAVEKDPERRFTSALEFSRALKNYQHAEDEDVFRELSELVRQDFQLLPDAVGIEPLKTREEALAAYIPDPPPPSIDLGAQEQSLASLGGQVGAGDTSQPYQGGASAITLSLGGPEIPPDEQRAKSKSKLNTLLGIVLGVSAVALLIGALFGKNFGAQSQQVIVFGGDNQAVSSNAPASAEAPQTENLNSNKAAPSTGSEANAPEANTLPPAVSVPKPRKQPVKASKKKPPSQKALLSSAVQKQSAALQSCFTAAANAGQKTNEAQLRFSVPQAGGQAKVQVSPAAVATSALGSCLQSAAKRTSFPKLQAAVSFSVPVRARRSR